MLAENAIKHGISTLIEGGEIEIKTEKNQENLIITVINSGTLKTEVDLGIGIENTRRRLDLQYNGLAYFELFEKDNKVISSITFKL
jgi:LytS/YehU family sensor histidine kinase